MERTNIPLNRAKLNALRLFDEWLLLAVLSDYRLLTLAEAVLDVHERMIHIQ